MLNDPTLERHSLFKRRSDELHFQIFRNNYLPGDKKKFAYFFQLSKHHFDFVFGLSKRVFTL